MNILRDAFFLLADEPCITCKKRQDCRDNKKACPDFVYYVNDDKSTHMPKWAICARNHGRGRDATHATYLAVYAE